MVDQIDGPIAFLEYTNPNEESFGAFNKESEGGVEEGGEGVHFTEPTAFTKLPTSETTSSSQPASQPTNTETFGDFNIMESEYSIKIVMNQTIKIFSMKRRKRRERLPNDYDEILVGKVGPDLGFAETDVVDKSLKGKVVGDELVYCSSDAFSVESDTDNEIGPRRSMVWPLGMAFEDVKEFREVVTKYSLQKGVQLEKYINEPKKFGRILDYRDEMLRTNPGSTCVVKVDDSEGSGRVGLQSVLKDFLLEVEHMMCARHVLANWSKNWRGLQRRNQLWKCAKSTFEGELKSNLALMELLGNKNIVEDLLYYKVQTWCKMYFRTNIKCDSIDNNMFESFNAWILGTRHKTIITMLEEIKVKVMTRIVQLSQFPYTWLTNISPMALRVLEKNHREVNEMASMFKGIPCPHSIVAIFYKKWESIDFVDNCYSKETYLRTYCHFLQPITNMKMWPDSTNPHVQPPVVKSMPSRPRKVGRKESHLKGKKAISTYEVVQEPVRGRGRPRKTLANGMPICMPRRTSFAEWFENPTSYQLPVAPTPHVASQSSARNSNAPTSYDAPVEPPAKRSKTIGMDVFFDVGVFVAKDGFTAYNHGLTSSRIIHTGSREPTRSANVTGDLGYKQGL
ncbi:hypothetical protein H5410_050195, partial [Solanum commersonii]